MEGQMRRDRTEVCNGGEYIIMLVRREKERGTEMRGDGLENGHLLG